MSLKKKFGGRKIFIPVSPGIGISPVNALGMGKRRRMKRGLGITKNPDLNDEIARRRNVDNYLERVALNDIREARDKKDLLRWARMPASRQ